MNKNSSDQFTLDEVLVSPSRNELELDGKVLRLQPKVMEVLHYLARHSDRVISKDELAEELWSGRVVTHGSIQKSINLLRKSLTELLGEREVIAHYSKKGYQLQLQPRFLIPDQSAPPDSGSADSKRRPQRQLALAGAVGLVVFITAAWLFLNRHTLMLDKAHRVEFSTVKAYTSATGYEFAAEPHPGGEHLVYIRRLTGSFDQPGSDSQLVVRGRQGQEWPFASTQGRWIETAWSPSGKSLVAVELIPDDGQPLMPDFYSNEPQLYDVHIFRLDLAASRVLEKHRLSQWQGSISSVTWWDEDTVELVARQGDRMINQRYRYAVAAQYLDVVESPEYVSSPLLTRIHQQHSALVSSHNETIRVDFLAPDQSRYASRQLTAGSVELSWIPDGSGVLVYSHEDDALSVIYRNGDMLSLEVAQKPGNFTSHYRYAADGERVYYTEVQPQASLWRLTQEGAREALADGDGFNYAPRFSPTGDTVAYVSVQDEVSRLWLVNEGQHQQIFQIAQGHIDAVNWTADGESILFRVDSVIYRYRMSTGQSSVVFGDAANITPLALTPEGDHLLVLRAGGESRNLWRIDLTTGAERQLTFGSVGSAIEHNGNVYFNYSGQKGLWGLLRGSSDVAQLTSEAERNTKLLGASSDAVYYITGGECRESDIYRLSLDDFTKSIYLARQEKRVRSHSFHPDQGILYSYCALPEANIMMLTNAAQLRPGLPKQ